MKSIFLLSIALFIVSFAASANQKFVCDNNGNKRLVSLVYQNKQAQVPCEVRYDKGDGEQILWQAQSEVGYCEARVNEFIQQQESWGWTCRKFEVSDTENEDITQNTAEHLEELHTSLY